MTRTLVRTAVLAAITLVVLVSSGGHVAQAATVISTVAGSKTFCGDGGARASACFNSPVNLARDASGNIYVSDNGNHRIRKIAPDGTVSAYAGNGTGAFCGDGGAAASACLDYPIGIALDAAGNLYVADSNNDRVRKVDAITNVITTVAGGGACVLPNVGDGALATNACLNSPRGVAIDSGGHLFIADALRHRIRRVDAGTGVITTVAGTGTSGTCGDGGTATSACLNRPRGLTFGPGDVLYIADETNNRIRRLSGGILSTVAGGGSCVAPSVGDGLTATSACLNSPRGVAVDATGRMFIADSSNDRVRQVSTLGIISTIAGNGTDAYCGDGGAATSACISNPDDVLLDGAGGYLVPGAFEDRIRAVSAGGTITTFAGIGNFCGDGGPAASACLSDVQAVVAGPGGYTYLADTLNHRVRRITPGGTIETFAGNGTPAFCGDGAAAASACLFFPRGLAFDAAGNLYIADGSNNRIRKVTPGGTISTVAGDGTRGYCGDGGPPASACLNLPRDVAVSPVTGELYIADTTNDRVRKLSGGAITTVAGNGTAAYCGDGGPATSACIDSPRGIAFDSAGNLYIADAVNDRVRKVTGTTIDTVAGNGLASFAGDGGAATSASIDRPEGVAVDASGKLYISDHFSGRIRVVTAGIISTHAGSSANGFCGDGGAPASACIALPRGLAIDGTGSLLIADSGNRRIRRVASDTVTDTDADGIPDATDNCPAVPNPGQADADADALGTACDPNDANPNIDADACADGEEDPLTNPNAALGGDRDPQNFWDFFDVTGDQTVDLSDTLDVLGYFGDAGTSPLANLRDRDAFNAAKLWRTSEGNDGVDLTDALNSLSSFGHDCSLPP